MYIGNILQRYRSSKARICQLKLRYGWFWLPTNIEVGGLSYTGCNLIVGNFNWPDGMGKV